MATLVLNGVLEDYFETGTEGTYWSLCLDAEDESILGPYDRLWVLSEGDYLTIFEKDGSVKFEGIIEPDREIGYQSYPRNPEYGQPLALGRWIHWTQKGWQPDDWARLFIPEIDRDEFDLAVFETFAEKGELELLRLASSPEGLPWPSPEYQRYYSIRWEVECKFRLKGEVKREISGWSLESEKDRAVYERYLAECRKRDVLPLHEQTNPGNNDYYLDLLVRKAMREEVQ